MSEVYEVGLRKDNTYRLEMSVKVVLQQPIILKFPLTGGGGGGEEKLAVLAMRF